MAITRSYLGDVEEQILSIVRQADGPYPSAEVIRQLSDEGVATSHVKTAMWFLVDRNAVDLSMDWHLTAHASDPMGAVDTSPATSVG